MKKLLFFACLLCGIKTVSAQEIIALQIDSSANIRKIIVPSYDNLFKLLNASAKEYETTLSALDYVKTEEKDADAYCAKSTDKNVVFSIIKQEKEIDIAFNVHTEYPKLMKEALLKKITNLTYKRVKGMDTYYFAINNNAGAEVQYCMLFDISKKGGGGVTLLELE